jgi:signal transduction histidine kinase
MGASTSPGALRSVRAGPVLVALGAAMLVALGALAVAVLPDRRTVLYQATLPALLSLGVLFLGAQMVRRDAEDAPATYTLAWFGGGALVVVAGGWYVFLQRTTMTTFSPEMAVVTAVTLGGFFGVLVGTFQYRARVRARELSRRRAEQEAAERERERVALLSEIHRHHLLNRLNVVLGYAQLLEGRVDTDAEADRRALEAQCERMTETVESVRAVSRAVTGETTLEPVALRLKLTDLVAKARDAYPDAEIRFDAPPPETVEADELLDVALRNLLTNAIVHNDGDATVEVSARVRTDVVEVVVADDGPGIPDDEKEAVFEPSVSAEGDADTGIGLFLARTVVRRYGGDVRIEDNEPCGTVVRMELPLAGTRGAGEGEEAATA